MIVLWNQFYFEAKQRYLNLKDYTNGKIDLIFHKFANWLFKIIDKLGMTWFWLQGRLNCKHVEQWNSTRKNHSNILNGENNYALAA